MADFYDHPDTGKMHFRGPAGGGTSFFDGVATATDIRNHPAEHRNYLDAKRVAHDRAEREEEARLAALKAEEAELEGEIAAQHTEPPIEL